MYSILSKASLLDDYVVLNGEITQNKLAYFQDMARTGNIPMSIIDKLENSIRIMETLYEPENWDLQIWPVDYSDGDLGDTTVRNFPLIVIRYPEFTITNSKNQSHIIRELYVAIPIVVDETNVPRLEICGIRTSLSDSEYMATYFHSHLRRFDRSSTSNLGTFCTGSDSLLSTILVLKANWSEKNFEMFLHQLDDFVMWESLEGGPHAKIDSIHNRAAIATLELSFSEINNIHSLIKENLHTEEFDIGIENGRYVIVDNEKLDKALVRILPKIYLTIRGEDGKHYEIKNNNLNEEYRKSLIFMWKRKCITETSIYPSVKDNEYNRVVHPAIKKMVINRLETLITQKTLHNE